jgi:maltose alpha-D-glucosyltransferase/alpha-amylase
VRDQERDPDSLLSWFERLIRTLRECPESGVGTCRVVDAELPRAVLAHRFDAPEGSMLFLHNLADRKATVDLGRLEGAARPSDIRPTDIFTDAAYPPLRPDLAGIDLNGWGYRWIRLRRGMND